MTKLLVIIAGPTASGKTRLAIDLALHFKTEIVSADSRQFYKEITIGTAKPTEAELREVPHHFINSHSITETVTAGTYAADAGKVLNALFETHDVVIMAGGSGLYIDAVIHGIDDLPEASATIRSDLEKQLKTDGISALRTQLERLDPDAYKHIDINNPRRLIRALEVTLASGVPYSSLLGKKQNNRSWNWLMAGYDWPRNELYERINARTESMILQGLKEEAASVIQYREKNALSTVGYKEMFEHLDSKINMEETSLLIAQHTRNYAKRQLTWFRRYEEMIWIKPGAEKELIDLINKRLRE